MYGSAVVLKNHILGTMKEALEREGSLFMAAKVRV